MKTAVIYQSETGFVKQYAQWLAQAIGADCFSCTEAEGKDLNAYGALVFGSWICAGKLQKLNRFKKKLKNWKGKVLAVFCVGAAPVGGENVRPFLEKIKRDFAGREVGAFYCPGGFHYERMPGRYKWMMKVFISAQKSKKNQTEDVRKMIEQIATDYDLSDEKYIAPIVEYLKAPH